MKISTSIFAADFLNLESDISTIIEKTDYIHMDIMDGNFVPNISFGIGIVEQVGHKFNKPLDVHLMVENPMQYLEKLVVLNCEIITFHIEKMNMKYFIKMYNFIKEKNSDIKIGLALNPDTPYELLLPYLDMIDLILVMTVEAGFYGQSFIEDVVEKLNMIREIVDDEQLNILIEVDGGINENTKNLVKNSDIIVAASYIFNSTDRGITIGKLKE